ncbi:MAG TPA: aldehyde dehydrogenase family protein, partial [Rubrobacter sp.]|nr:aldehyde dehydrogenase family protein [Rubrobacter sp.]
MIESQIESMNFIGGEWVPADSGETSEIVNPSNPSEVLGTTPKSDKAETERAIEAAAEALPDWKDTLPAARGAVLMEAANIIESREDELARLMALEAGKPMKEARMEVGRAASIFRY